jgi:F0F1-type ATP synthase membrane subunit b/b'
MTKIRVLAPVVGVLLLMVAAALAQKPVRNVSAGRHPNIAAAQKLSQQAFDKIVAAQQANEWDMQGHAQKAKDLLQQANNELREAATAANKNAK